MLRGQTPLEAPDPQVDGRFREYRVRKAFAMTHEQYLDESVASTDWMLIIDDAINDVRGEV